MDDNTFDELMKKKLEAYPEPPFEQSSFDALHHTFPIVRATPWYANTATRLFIVSSMLLFTLVNSAIVYSVFSEKNDLAINKNIANSELSMAKESSLAYTGAIDSLKNVIEKMQCDLQQAQLEKDQYKKPENNEDYFQRAYSSSDTKDAVRNITGNQAFHGGVNPNKTSTLLNDHPEPAERWQEKSPLVIEKFRFGSVRFVEVKSSSIESKIGEPIKNSAVLTLATQKAMDKHYFKGFGVEVAPHLDIVQGIFKHGESDIQPRLGIAADLILAPNWSVETGVDYFNISSHFNPADINVPAQINGSEYGSLHSVGTKFSLVSVPIALKYRQWVTTSNQLFFKLGLKPYVSASRELQYNYESSTSSPGQGMVQVALVDHRDEVKYFGTTMTAAIGLTSKMKNPKNKFEVSLFYEKSMGTVGQENLNMQLAGIRAAYWFKLK